MYPEQRYRLPENAMSTKVIKIAVTCLVLAAALGGLMYTTLAEGTEYYIHVDEVMKDPDAWQGKRLQLHGFVADLRQRPNSLDYKFQVQFNGKVIDAHLHRHRPRHVQERVGSRAEGEAAPATGSPSSRTA